MTKDFPVLTLFSLPDLERMVLIQTLHTIGVEDPPTFIEEHVIKYKCALKGNVGMAITISEITKKQTDSVPVDRMPVDGR